MKSHCGINEAEFVNPCVILPAGKNFSYVTTVRLSSINLSYILKWAVTLVSIILGYVNIMHETPDSEF